MGFFRHTERAAQQPAQTSFSSDPPMPNLTRGMTISVTLSDGDLLLTGRLTAFSGYSLSIERLPHALSFRTCEKDEKVYIRGCNQKLMPFIIEGTVDESSRTLFRMKDLRSLPLNENRDNFRLDLHAPASLYYLTDPHFQNPEECILVDISVGGACIQSEFLHAEGEALNLKVKLEDYATMDFLGEIIRVKELRSGAFQYGFLFAQLTEDEITTLTKTIYNIQVGNRSAIIEQNRG